MRRWRLRDTRGMSLVELMIVLVVMSIVSGAVVTLFLVSLRTYWTGSVRTQVQQGGRVGLDRLTRDLRAARRLYSGTAGGFAFSLACTPNPQISFVLPHVGTVTLSDNSTIYATDPNSSGTIPYDGSYVSYYLASSAGGQAPNSNGPYLIRTVYDIVANTLTSLTIANNVTSLTFSASGSCPTTSSREITVTVNAYQNAPGQSVSSTDIVTEDITLRNQ